MTLTCGGHHSLNSSFWTTCIFVDRKGGLTDQQPDELQELIPFFLKEV